MAVSNRLLSITISQHSGRKLWFVKSVYHNPSSFCSMCGHCSWLAISKKASLRKRNSTNQHFMFCLLRVEGGFVYVFVSVGGMTGRELAKFSRVEITEDNGLKPQAKLCISSFNTIFFLPWCGLKTLDWPAEGKELFTC